MTKPRPTQSNPLRCYGAFVSGRLDLRTLRETVPQSQAAGNLWNPKRRLGMKVCWVSWRRV